MPMMVPVREPVLVPLSCKQQHQYKHWYWCPCRAHNSTSTSPPVVLLLVPVTFLSHPCWYQHQYWCHTCTDTHTSVPSTPTPVSTVAPVPLPHRYQCGTDPAIRMMMRSGSRAMVKRKRLNTGPKAMKVHPKKMASVMTAGPRTRDREREQNPAAQLGLAQPLPLPSPPLPRPSGAA